MRFLNLLILVILVSCSAAPTRMPASLSLSEIEGNLDNKPFWILKPDGEFFTPLPVVYFLHGRGGNRHMFRDIGGVQAMKDYLANGGTPFVIVALTGTFEGKDSYWINETRNHILGRMIPQIEKEFSIGGDDNRMIAGISMGSHGAFQMGLTSKKFRCIAGHSLVLRDYESMNSQFPGLFGSKRKFATRDPISLIKKHKNKNKLHFKKAWVDIGGKDVADWVARAKIMETELLRLGFDPSSIDVGVSYPEGGHNNPYWKARFPEYLNWYGQCFL